MARLPKGTVTFLLTDVRGSTALWEEAPEAMRAALARHDGLFDEAVRQHGGAHIRPRGEGDSRFAVFSSASNAVTAALAIQRAFIAEDWPTPRPIRVRIGIHTGQAELRDGDYYGSDVNRCARLRDLGHGGQILLSGASVALAHDRLPAGARLLDLGEHYLRGLRQPERVHQLVAQGLSADFPPLSSLDVRRNNLPSQLTPLLGRDREVQTVRSLLLSREVRLATLTGPGGIGKTRLAFQIAAQLLGHFPDGVFFVPLAPISDPDLVLSPVAQALGVREDGGRSLRDVVAGFLRDKHVLLLLDNFEQILPAAPHVADLLAACPKLAILVTSRAPLHLRGEHEVSVPPLACPDPKDSSRIGALTEYAATALFAQRANAVKADFAVTDQSMPAVAEICRRLDGLPLAIELAAAWTKLVSPHVLLSRLERRLPLLTGGAKDLPARQRTLRETIAWSYDLLDPGEQELFRRLAVFVGGFALEAAETVCRPERKLGIEMLDRLMSLVDKSLLRPSDARGEPRFGMLETIREYAWERLETSGEAPQLRQAHAEHYLALAELAQPNLVGRNQVAWLETLEAEHDNFRAALTWSLETPEGAQVGMRLVCALYRFWQRRGHLSEGREWLARILTSTEPLHGEARARVLNGAGVLAVWQGDSPAARSFLEESLSIYRELGERRGLANALHNLASVMRHEGDYERATALLEESLAIWRELGDPWSLAQALRGRGLVALHQGANAVATTMCEESLGLLRQVGDLLGMALQLGELGVLARTRGDLERATLLHRQGLQMHQALSNREGIAWTLANLGRVAYARHDFEQASDLYHESLELYRELGHREGPVRCIEGLAAVAVSVGLPGRSARLLGAAQGLREAIRQPVPLSERASHDDVVTAIRALLSEEAFGAAWAEGRAMTLEQAVAYALERPTPT